MDPKLPFIEICGPDGQEATVELASERIRIGRLREFNDIALEPDPQQLITRMMHCAVEREGGNWWVIDNGSVNKTFLRSGQTIKVVEGRAPLSDGDTIRILGKLSESAGPVYWELTFRDPMKTFRAEGSLPVSYLEYDWIQAKLFKEVCTYSELIEAIWGDESFGRTENEINRLAWELRQKIETDQKEPKFLETVRGLGYRLVTRPLTK